MIAGTDTTQLSQKHYAEEVLRTYGYWDTPPRITPMKPNTRLSKDDCDMSPKPDFHKRYHGIVSSLGAPRPSMVVFQIEQIRSIPRSGAHGCG